MEFGVFDHLDDRGEPPGRTYDERLALVRAADEAGFHAYHLAEHHGTPIGLAPSPSVFLAAVARETTRLRFGAMVYCLPLYIPLRLLEEICMLDQLSGGRLEVGVGRGASPFESGFYGLAPEESVERYVETLEIIQRGLRSSVLDFEGRYYRYRAVPMTVRPVQARIPFWSAAATPEAQAHAARAGMHVMVLGATERVREVAGHYREIWPSMAPDPDVPPLIGAYRMVHVADSDAEAESRARPAFDLWFEHLAKLWRENDATTPFLQIRDFDTARAMGMMLAGSPSRVADALATQAQECGFNYAVLQFAFGDMPHRFERRSLELFAERVMPQVRGAVPHPPR